MRTALLVLVAAVAALAAPTPNPSPPAEVAPPTDRINKVWCSWPVCRRAAPAPRADMPRMLLGHILKDRD